MSCPSSFLRIYMDRDAVEVYQHVIRIKFLANRPSGIVSSVSGRDGPKPTL